MKKKPAFDFSRMEKEPPRVPEPWSIGKAKKVVIRYGLQCPFVLQKDGKYITDLLACSEDGAHREGMIFIKGMDF